MSTVEKHKNNKADPEMFKRHHELMKNRDYTIHEYLPLYHEASYETNHNGNSIKYYFRPHGDEKGHYDKEFSVNDSFDVTGDQGKSAVSIIKGSHDTLHHFINGGHKDLGYKDKPTKISWTIDDPKRAGYNRRIVQKITKNNPKWMAHEDPEGDFGHTFTLTHKDHIES